MQDRSFAADLDTVLKALRNTRETTAWPVLVVICGLPGTGKSFLARKIAGRMPAVIVESDFVRKTLFAQPTYAGAESVWVHRIAHVTIERLLKSGHRVIYDATNLSEWFREKTYHIADRAGAGLVVVVTVAPERVARERLLKRFQARDPDDLSDATVAVYERFKRRVEPVRHPHIVVDTSRDIRRAVSRIVRAAQPKE